MRKNKIDGAIPNAGAKPKYGEKTTTISFRVPISKAEEVKSIIKSMQDRWKL